MAKKTVHIFCDEKTLRDSIDGFSLGSEFLALENVVFSWISSEAELLRRLENRKSGIDAFVVYCKNNNRAVSFLADLAKELRKKIGAVVLVRFDDSAEYLEELNLQAVRLKKKGFRALFSYRETVAEVVDDWLKKMNGED